MNLLILILLPLLSAIAVLLSPAYQAKRVALFAAVLQLLASGFLLKAYYATRADGNQQQFLFEQQHTWFPSLHISLHLGVDGISIAMVLLTAFVVVAGILVSWTEQCMTKEFFFLLLLLSMGAYGFFMSLDLFVLFFFLEIAVIPKYLLIGMWGSGNKQYAANKLALLLMFGSALVLVGMLGACLGTDLKTFDLPLLANVQIPISVQQICFPLLFVGFGVFTALFPFHTWVPDGHSSAPTAGSMFLAGISMKLGGYGCLRVATYLMPQGAQQHANIIIIMASIAILYGAFATMMQQDFKYLNAYSSVSHCGFVLLGIGMLTKTAVTGAVLQMVSHGVMTALFFAIIGMIYERTHTRQIKEMGGLLKVTPFISSALFIVGLCSLGLPGLSGFVAEMTIFVGSWQNNDSFHRIATIIACMSIVVTAVYILRAIGTVAMGPLKAQYASITDATWNERLAIIVLVVAILIIGLSPGWLNELVKPGAAIIVERLKAP